MAAISLVCSLLAELILTRFRQFPAGSADNHLRWPEEQRRRRRTAIDASAPGRGSGEGEASLSASRDAGGLRGQEVMGRGGWGGGGRSMFRNIGQDSGKREPNLLPDVTDRPHRSLEKIHKSESFGLWRWIGWMEESPRGGVHVHMSPQVLPPRQSSSTQSFTFQTFSTEQL